VGVFSRLSYWKGQHVLLEAMREPPGVHALLAGEALFGKLSTSHNLKALVSLPELAGRIHWLDFVVMPALMATCNIVVHTSTGTGAIWSVIVEGQLSGRPVATAGGAVELIQDGVTGRLVPPGDAVALARTLRELWQTHWQWRLWRNGVVPMHGLLFPALLVALTALRGGSRGVGSRDCWGAGEFSCLCLSPSPVSCVG